MLQNFANIIRSKKIEIDAWYEAKLAKGNTCFYSSVDIRYSGDKLVPVDTNLFPAGFNNLKNTAKASGFAQNYIESNFTNIKKILLIGEDHTRNFHYLDNLINLEVIIRDAGYDCKIGSFSLEEAFNYKESIIHPLVKDGSILRAADGFIPDLIVLNNDLMNGVPDKITNIEQKIVPHPNNGWFKRRKSHHFAIYNELVMELGDLFAFPVKNLIADFSICDAVNFKDKIGLEDLAEKVDVLLKRIKSQYQENGIKDDPYVVIKSDYGTYGMGIMIAKSADEIRSLNKKNRKQMHVTKSNMVNEQVIIQEGVKTIDVVDGNAAEPMIYMVDHKEVAFFYRSHTEKDEYGNLNSVGMQIVSKQVSEDYQVCCNFIARLATLAAALES